MSLAAVARAYYAAQADLSDRAQRDVRSLWAELDPAALSSSWLASRLGLRLFVALASAQLAAASMAVIYVAAALVQQGARSAPLSTLAPRSLAGVASDGRDLETLLTRPLVRTKVAIRDGHTPARALQIGGSALDTIVGTQVADAGRVAAGVATAVEPAATGWVRMLVPPSCGRCAVLAGRFYRYSDGFLRHPQDDCMSIPAVEDAADDLRTDPRAYFDSLSEADQDRYFGVANARAIRDGADMNRVVNATGRTSGMSVAGFTTEATTRRGTGRRVRLTPEGIYAAATDRGDAVRLLRLHGYIV